MSEQSYFFESPEALLKCFRPNDQKNVFIPKTLKFPLSLGHYLTWQEPSGVRIYLVFKKSEWKAPLGVAFRRDQQSSLGSPPCVCNWCIHHGPSDEVGLLTARVHSKKRAGVYLCRDLSCVSKLETMASLSGKSFDKLVEKLIQQMARFCSEGLGFEGMSSKDL